MADDSGSGSHTPADNDDDFFSSWDKPTIKRPSNPPSRAATPAGINRTASPFLSAPSNGPVRPKSPLAGSDSTAPRATASAAIRKTPVAGAAPRKANILGAKKTSKLGAKKVTAADDLDFDEAERKAKEEAERIAKLGYDPDVEEASSAPQVVRKVSTSASNILSPTPVSPGGFGQTKTTSDVDTVGTGISRLGFGQVGASASKGTAAQGSSRMGFGSMGRGVQQGVHRSVNATGEVLTNLQKKQTELREPNLARKRAYPLMNSLEGRNSTRTRKLRRKEDYKALKERRPYPVMPTSVGQKMRTTARTTEIWRPRRKTWSGSLESPLATTWTT